MSSNDIASSSSSSSSSSSISASNDDVRSTNPVESEAMVALRESQERCDDENTTTTNAMQSTTIKKKRVDDFEFTKVLGKGSYGVVKLATEKETLKQYAIKILNKQHIIKEKKAKYVQTEKLILDQLKHPNIITLFYTFQDPTKLCMLPY